MKNRLLCILLIALFCLASCKKSNNIVYYDFKEDDFLLEGLENIVMELEYGNDYYQFFEQKGYYYYQFNSLIYIIDSNNEITYAVDKESLTIKKVDKESVFYLSKDHIIKMYTKLFSAQKKYNGKLVKKEEKEILNTIVDTYVLQNNSSTVTYFIDKEFGRCLKCEIEEAGKNEGWSFTKFIEDENYVSNLLHEYLNYEIDFTNYTSWPDTYLASLLPKFSGGNKLYIIDNQSIFNASFEIVSLYEVKQYIEKIDQTYFLNKEIENKESGEIIYSFTSLKNELLTIRYFEETITIKLEK